MKRCIILCLLLMVVVVSVVQAQAPATAPKPDPEIKKLQVLVGHWTFDGVQKPGPLGPGGKFTGEFNGRMILGGFFLQCQVSGKVAESEMRVLEIDGYDPVNKNLSSEMYLGDGSRFAGVITIAGNTWTYAGKWAVAGKQYQLKDSVTFAPDWTSATEKVEISADGKTWTPLFEDEWTKVRPTVKK